jgi:hypothetical protein
MRSILNSTDRGKDSQTGRPDFKAAEGITYPLLFIYIHHFLLLKLTPEQGMRTSFYGSP